MLSSSFIIMNEIIDKLKNDMIEEAIKKHSHIYPPFVCNSIEDSFTFEDNKILLWFNTKDLTTKMLEREMPS